MNQYPTYNMGISCNLVTCNKAINCRIKKKNSSIITLNCTLRLSHLVFFFHEIRKALTNQNAYQLSFMGRLRLHRPHPP